VCGIVAIASSSNAETSTQLDAMLSRIAYRGPDGVGQATLDRVSLGHRRLAIIDVAHGAQPLLKKNRSAAAVVNGEIYNHRLLRRELESLHGFTSNSDSETVLHGCDAFGPRFVKRLDGMFAFVFTDGQRVIAARDPLGVKPLYVGRGGAGQLYFASEMKSLVDHADSIECLPPGHFFSSERGTERYFTPHWSTIPRNEEARRHALRDVLDRSVKKRLMSDVPVGLFLSGGLDSSLVAAFAVERVPRLHSFSVGVEGAPDLGLAREVARTLRTQHHEIVLGAREVEASLLDVVYHLESYDPALVRSAVPCFLLSRRASELVKVVLTGEGADEAFAGYSYLSAIRDPKALQKECERLLHGLHAMNLQRVDRMTMAHGLEGRVPFLDIELLRVAMSFDPSLKLHSADHPAKWLLRQAAQGLLPDEILWRPKSEFSAGSGVEPILERYAEENVTDRDFARRAELFPVDTPRSKEELLYRRMFEGLFPGDKIRHLVARWRAGDVSVATPPAATTDTGHRTYRQTVARGFYGRYEGGLRGKYDNVRVYWEDQITLATLRPHLHELARERRSSLRVLDLGCGAGQGFDLLTSVRGVSAPMAKRARQVLEVGDIGLYYGIDLSAAMVEQGRRNFEGVRQVRFDQADLREGLRAVRPEAPFDLYLSTYASLSHLGTEDFERLLRDVAAHARSGSLLVLDLMGRHSLEWPTYWAGTAENDRYREYSMSYLHAPDERKSEDVERFRIRYWTRAELEEICRRLSTSAYRLDLERTVDRSLFVGRHIDTAEYGTTLPPLRSAVNRLHEPHVRTELVDLELTHREVPGFPEQNRVFGELAAAWNTLVQFAQDRLSGKRVALPSLEGWSAFSPILQSALLHFDRAVDSLGWMSAGEPRENLLEPQLGYLLRDLEQAFQPGLGYGHGLLGVVRIIKN
jgi:asparagine synthase (glutamine-hydrolysing)